MVQLFGFDISRPEDLRSGKEAQREKQLVPDLYDDGAAEASPTMGGAYGTAIDLEGNAKNQAALINRYRQMSQQPECDQAIDDIVNEAVDMDWKSDPVAINLDDVKESDSIKDIIREEYDNVVELLDFRNRGYDVFRQWYIDGQLYFQLVIDHKKPKDGIKKAVMVDPRKIRKVRKPRIKRNDVSGGPGDLSGAPLYLKSEEYYVYNPQGVGAGFVFSQQGVRIAKDSIAHCTSGIVDPKHKMVLSNLHKAIKPLNNLRHMEDSSVIYRLARAPERRLFYLDVGNLPPMKAEQYLREMMNKYKNKLIYDANTGAIRDDRRFLTMLEDFWLPRREGARGSEISTLPGGANLGEISDIEYFQTKLYKALNVPVSRLNDEGVFNIGRPSEITRDEVKFNKFVIRLRKRFTNLFDTILGRQLILKGVLNSIQWGIIKTNIAYDWRNDNHFAELKEIEIARERIATATEADPFAGKYYSKRWIRSELLRQTEEDMEQMNSEMEEEHEQDVQMATQMGADPNDPNAMGDGPGNPSMSGGGGISSTTRSGSSKGAGSGGGAGPTGKEPKYRSERSSLITRKRRYKHHPILPVDAEVINN